MKGDPTQRAARDWTGLSVGRWSSPRRGRLSANCPGDPVAGSLSGLGARAGTHGYSSSPNLAAGSAAAAWIQSAADCAAFSLTCRTASMCDSALRAFS